MVRTVDLQDVLQESLVSSIPAACADRRWQDNNMYTHEVTVWMQLEAACARLRHLCATRDAFSPCACYNS